ncbi:MAG TPA: hypothetical protein VHF25_08830 [Nitriliruptorales bacterium]|nr:hypothetical protein [Nitriliruptorales bacterium]
MSNAAWLQIMLVAALLDHTAPATHGVRATKVPQPATPVGSRLCHTSRVARPATGR